MRKVLLVDDESLIRKGLREKIDWEQLGFTIAAEASNGLQALEMARELLPELIITDMKMPVWDGIQLLRALKENRIPAKVVVISAYSSFQFTQTAIQCGAFDYLLKPIDSQELRQVLERVKAEAADTPASEGQPVTDAVPDMREKFLRSFVTSDILPGSAAGLPADKRHYTCLAVLLPVMERVAQRNFSRDYAALFSELSMRLEALSRQQSYVLLPLRNPKYFRHLYVVIGHNFEQTESLSAVVERVKTDLESCIQHPVAIGVGGDCTSVRELSRSATQAMNALSYRSISGESCIIYIDSATAMSLGSLEYPSEEENTFLTALEIGNFEEVEHNLNVLFAHIREEERITFRQVYKLFSELLFLCERVLRKYKISFEQIFDEDITSIDYIAGKGSLPELEQWFLEVIEKILKLITDQKCSDVSKLIDEIRQYIDTHYFEDIHLGELSQKYYINKSYLSELFKKRVGQNFSDYLTGVRLGQAARLLSDKTSYKVYEIAQLVGYSDARYFAKQFKKRFGVTPEHYRTAVSKGDK